MEWTKGGRSHFFRLRLRSCSKMFESGSANFSNCESDSCPDSGYNHQSNLNLPMFLLKNDRTDSCCCRNWKVTPDPVPVFPKFLTPGPDPVPKEKSRILLELTPVPGPGPTSGLDWRLWLHRQRSMTFWKLDLKWNGSVRTPQAVLRFADGGFFKWFLHDKTSSAVSVDVTFVSNCRECNCYIFGHSSVLMLKQLCGLGFVLVDAGPSPAGGQFICARPLHFVNFVSSCLALLHTFNILFRPLHFIIFVFIMFGPCFIHSIFYFKNVPPCGF